MRDTLRSLQDAIFDYDDEKAASLAERAMSDGMDPNKAMNAVTEAIRDIGEEFGRGEIFLPELIAAAKAVQCAIVPIEAAIKRSGKESERAGTVVLGTVSGDIHDIGKTMVGALLAANGFRVIDLGTDVPAHKFVEAVRDNHADVLALSALLTTTAVEQKKVIHALEEAGLRDKVRIMVGGGALTEGFAHEIGADGYGATAPEGVNLALAFVRNGR